MLVKYHSQTKSFADMKTVRKVVIVSFVVKKFDYIFCRKLYHEKISEKK
jgi:hypothetical protein